jgi:hypothetical protein
MTKKKIDEGAMVTELREASVFFRTPETDEPGSLDNPPPTQVGKQVVTPLDRTSGRTVGRCAKRIPKRYPFEFYQDQLEELKRLSLAEQIDGGKGNMSEMVREAVDDWLAKRRAEHQPE